MSYKGAVIEQINTYNGTTTSTSSIYNVDIMITQDKITINKKMYGLDIFEKVDERFTLKNQSYETGWLEIDLNSKTFKITKYSGSGIDSSSEENGIIY